MCLSPVTIENPYYKIDKKRLKLSPGMIRAPITHNYWDSHIQVPCGHCAACLEQAQSATVQRFREMSREYYIWFFTLTYDDEHLNKIVIGEYTHEYAPVEDMQNFIRTFRNNVNLPFELRDNFSYWVTSEYGHTGHRPHWHGFLMFRMSALHEAGAIPQMLNDELFRAFKYSWSVNVGTKKHPKREPRCQWIRRVLGPGRIKSTYDFHLIEPRWSPVQHKLVDIEDVAFYCSKYCLKFDEWLKRKQQALRLNLDPDSYREAWSLIKTHQLVSKGFGLIENSDIPQMIDRNYKKFGYPVYVNNDGSTWPMSRYLREKYVTQEQVWKYDPNYQNSDVGDVVQHDIESDTISAKVTRQQKYERKVATIKKYD